MKRLFIGLVLLALLIPSLAVGQGARFVALADVSVTAAVVLLRAANASRIALVCTNTGGVNIRVGDATVTATQGVQLRPGASITITSTALINGFSEGAASIIACSEESK